MKSHSLYVIAGPNGSGKTTFARKFLPIYAGCTHFINADLIAQGLSPFSPAVAAMKAGRLVLSPNLALERIKDRVASGGHDVPAPDVRRRFRRSVENFVKVYEPLFDSWMFFDNSEEIPRLVAEKTNGKLSIKDVQLFDKISKGNGNGV